MNKRKLLKKLTRDFEEVVRFRNDHARYFSYMDNVLGRLQSVEGQLAKLTEPWVLPVIERPKRCETCKWWGRGWEKDNERQPCHLRRDPVEWFPPNWWCGEWEAQDVKE